MYEQSFQAQPQQQVQQQIQQSQILQPQMMPPITSPTQPEGYYYDGSKLLGKRPFDQRSQQYTHIPSPMLRQFPVYSHIPPPLPMAPNYLLGPKLSENVAQDDKSISEILLKYTHQFQNIFQNLQIDLEQNLKRQRTEAQQPVDEPIEPASSPPTPQIPIPVQTEKEKPQKQLDQHAQVEPDPPQVQIQAPVVQQVERLQPEIPPPQVSKPVIQEVKPKTPGWQNTGAQSMVDNGQSQHSNSSSSSGGSAGACPLSYVSPEVGNQDDEFQPSPNEGRTATDISAIMVDIDRMRPHWLDIEDIETPADGAMDEIYENKAPIESDSAAFKANALGCAGRGGRAARGGRVYGQRGGTSRGGNKRRNTRTPKKRIEPRVVSEDIKSNPKSDQTQQRPDTVHQGLQELAKIGHKMVIESPKIIEEINDQIQMSIEKEQPPAQKQLDLKSDAKNILNKRVTIGSVVTDKKQEKPVKEKDWKDNTALEIFKIDILKLYRERASGSGSSSQFEQLIPACFRDLKVMELRKYESLSQYVVRNAKPKQVYLDPVYIEECKQKVRFPKEMMLKMAERIINSKKVEPNNYVPQAKGGLQPKRKSQLSKTSGIQDEIEMAQQRNRDFQSKLVDTYRATDNKQTWASQSGGLEALAKAEQQQIELIPKPDDEPTTEAIEKVEKTITPAANSSPPASQQTKQYRPESPDYNINKHQHHDVNNRYNNVLESPHGDSLYKVLNFQSPLNQNEDTHVRDKYDTHVQNPSEADSYKKRPDQKEIPSSSAEYVGKGNKQQHRSPAEEPGWGEKRQTNQE